MRQTFPFYVNVFAFWGLHEFYSPQIYTIIQQMFIPFYIYEWVMKHTQFFQWTLILLLTFQVWTYWIDKFSKWKSDFEQVQAIKLHTLTDSQQTFIYHWNQSVYAKKCKNTLHCQKNMALEGNYSNITGLKKDKIIDCIYIEFIFFIILGKYFKFYF